MSIFAEIPPQERALGHRCGSCQVLHVGDYGMLCRTERMRLFPANFERWPESAHRSRSAFTWEQQQAIWWHMDAWEDCFAGRATLADTRALIATLPPLPAPSAVGLMVRDVARSKTTRPVAAVVSDKPPLTREQERDLLALVSPVKAEVAA